MTKSIVFNLVAFVLCIGLLFALNWIKTICKMRVKELKK